MKSCWICNTNGAPKELDVDGIQNGIAQSMSLSSERVARRKEYWSGFDLDGEYWNATQKQHIEVLNAFFGHTGNIMRLTMGNFRQRTRAYDTFSGNHRL